MENHGVTQRGDNDDETRLSMTRQCSGCTLCCKLLPMTSRKSPEVKRALDAMLAHGLASNSEAASMVPDFDKPAGERCPHQRTFKGCGIYATRPFGCRYWNCRWLVNNDTADLGRPDRSHYVIDIMPDFVTMQDHETGKTTQLEVVQIWCDPKHPDAHHDPALRAYLLRRAAENIIGLVRYNERDAFALLPPTMTVDKQWREQHGNVEKEHTVADLVKALR